MVTVHSDNPDWNFYVNTIEQVIDDFEKHILGFADALKTFDFTLLPQNIMHSAANMTAELVSVLAKIKKAYVYGCYHPKSSYIERLDYCRKTVQNSKSFLKVKTGLKPAAPTLLAKVKSKLDNIKNNYVNAVNTAQKIVDIHKSGFCYCKNFWPPSSVLVGTLRNRGQLNVAISKKFYHIPKHLVENPCDIKCVAIYQSKNLFGKHSGIKYYGRVKDFKLIPRNMITEIPRQAEEIYVKFEIEEWKMLKSPKTADYLGDVCVQTTLFQFINCEKASELLILGYDEYTLYEFMKSRCFSPDAGICRFKGGDAVYNGKMFEVFCRNKSIYKITNEQFFKNPAATVKTIGERLALAQMQNLT